MEQQIVTGLMAFLGIAGTGIMGYIARAVVKFIIQKHLEAVALQSVHYAEDACKFLSGSGKLKEACEWVSNRMKKYHIKIDEAQIEGAVRAAYQICVKTADKELK